MIVDTVVVTQLPNLFDWRMYIVIGDEEEFIGIVTMFLDMQEGENILATSMMEEKVKELLPESCENNKSVPIVFVHSGTVDEELNEQA